MVGAEGGDAWLGGCGCFCERGVGGWGGASGWKSGVVRFISVVVDCEAFGDEGKRESKVLFEIGLL
jgi:hypothetical protein